MDSRYYPGVEADVPKLIAELRKLFDEDYEIQTMNVSATTVLQARKSSTLREMTGLSANSNRALGREKRAKISPVISDIEKIPVNSSTVAMKCQ